MKLVFCLVVCCFFAPVFSQLARIRGVVGTNALDHVAVTVNTLALQTVQEMGAVDLGTDDFKSPVVSIQVNDSTALIQGWKELTLQPSETGLIVSISDIAIVINLDANFKIFGFISAGSLSATANLNDTSVSLGLTVKALEGNPQIEVSDVSIDIGSIVIISGNKYLDWLLDGLSGIVKRQINRMVPALIQTEISTSLNPALMNLTLSTFLDPKNLTVFNFSLAGDPSFTDSSVAFDLLGDAYVAGKKSCQLNMSSLPETGSENFTVYVSETVSSCALQALVNSGYVDGEIMSLLSSNFDGRLRVIPDFLVSKPVTTFSSKGLYIGLSPELEIEAPTAPKAPRAAMAQFLDRSEVRGSHASLLTVGMGFKAYLDASLARHAQNITVTGQISSIEALLLAIKNVSSSLPAAYRREILDTDKEELSQEATDFITENVLPALNQQLSDGLELQVPKEVWEFVQSLSLDWNSGYLSLNAEPA